MQFIGFWRTKVVSIALARLWRSFVLVVFTTIVCGIAAPAVQAKAKFAAITVDARNGKLLYAENADAIRHPASLTKMMTLYVLFRDLKAGKIRLSSPIRMSARAASMAPSKLGVKPGKSITVETAIRALVVKSANDVAAAVAENLGGTERAFAQRMTSTARAIGMSRTTFVNASGLPDPAQVTTARDMATLGLRLMRDFPQYYPYFRTQSFVYNGRTIKGHNRLLGRYEGTDGIKTGYINASGFNLVTSARRGNKRLVGVVLGGRSGASRDAYMKKMLSQHFGRAANGSTVAAVAGSSSGAIDPVKVVSNSRSVASANSTGEKRPKGSIFGGKKKVEPEPETITETEVAEVQQVPSPVVQQAPSPEEGDTDEDTAESQTANDSAATEGQTIKQVEVEVAAEPAGPSVIEAGLVDSKTVADPGQPVETQQLASLAADDGWSIQIGIYSTEGDALARLQEVRKKLPEIFDGKTTQALPLEQGGKVIYRARFTGFEQSAAKAACGRVSRKKSACFIQGPT